MIFPPRPWNPRIPRTFPSSQLRAHSRAHLPTQIECEIIWIPFHTQPAREIVTQRPKKSPFVQVPPSHWCQSGGLLDLEAHNFLARSHWAIKLNVQLKRSATNGWFERPNNDVSAPVWWAQLGTNLLPCRSDKAGPSVNAPRNGPHGWGRGRGRGELTGCKFPASAHHLLAGTRQESWFS
jgi:hypothetical protein